MEKGLTLEELKVYCVAVEIGDLVWNSVLNWNSFAKYTLGKQIVNSADSIALNIAEGYGRYYYKENRNFCYYSRGSAKETLSAIEKAKARSLLSQQEYELLLEKLDLYFRLMFGYKFNWPK